MFDALGGFTPTRVASQFTYKLRLLESLYFGFKRGDSRLNSGQLEE